MSNVKISLSVPRYLAAGLDLIAIADGCERQDVLIRAAQQELENSGLRGALEQLAPKRKQAR
jgi:hypothetical protein